MLYHLYYFSGTGNTENSVRRIAEALEGKGHTVRTEYITRSGRPAAGTPDCLILAYPTYAWRPPALVSRFVARLPFGNGTPAAVFTADGGGSYGSVDVAESMLRRRGYRTVLKGAAHYPQNWIQMTPPPDAEARAHAVESGISDTDRFIRALEAGETIERERSRIDGLLGLVGILFTVFGRHFLGKLFIADEDCTSCGLCARSCPAGAIILKHGSNSRPRWTWGCESCNRCINTCPTRAINTSLVRGATLLLFSTVVIILGFRAVSGVSARMMDLLPSAAFVSIRILANILVVLGGPIIAASALDAVLLRPLLAIPAFRALAQRSFTKEFPRYSFEGFRAPSERPPVANS